MVIGQGRFWKASLAKAEDAVELVLLKDSLPDEFYDVRELRFEIPLVKWNGVVKHVLSDRKLLGGILLDFASHKDHVATTVGTAGKFIWPSIGCRSKAIDHHPLLSAGDTSPRIWRTFSFDSREGTYLW